MAKKQGVRRKHIPQRTCVACRQKTDKRRLTRIVATPDSGVVVDPTGKKNGRGAYVCEQTACWDKIIQSQLLDKALKTAVSDTEKDAINSHRPPQPAPH